MAEVPGKIEGMFQKSRIAVVSSNSPKPIPQPAASKDRPIRRARKLEAQGLLMITLLILIYALLRYWHSIPWGAR